jgi:hypothetical protein
VPLPKHCFFCENPIVGKSRAKEDIVPKWIQKHKEIYHETITQYLWDKDRSKTFLRKHNLGSLLAGDVCSDCNNGWMSQLENDCIPILKALWRKDILLNALHSAERVRLSAWVAKTTYALLSASHYSAVVPRTHVRHLHQFKEVHSDVFVFGAHASEGSANGIKAWWLWNLLGEPTEEEVRLMEAHSHKVGFGFDNLILILAHLPLLDRKVALNWRLLLPLAGNENRLLYVEPSRFESEASSPSEFLQKLIDASFGVKGNFAPGPYITEREGGQAWRVDAKPSYVGK